MTSERTWIPPGTDVVVTTKAGSVVTGKLTRLYDSGDYEYTDVRLAPATIVYAYHVAGVARLEPRPCGFVFLADEPEIVCPLAEGHGGMHMAGAWPTVKVASR